MYNVYTASTQLGKTCIKFTYLKCYILEIGLLDQFIISMEEGTKENVKWLFYLYPLQLHVCLPVHNGWSSIWFFLTCHLNVLYSVPVNENIPCTDPVYKSICQYVWDNNDQHTLINTCLIVTYQPLFWLQNQEHLSAKS